MAPRKRLGQLLLELKAVDEHQLQSALGHQKQWGGKLGTILVQKGFIREDEMVRVLSQHVGMPSVKLGEAKVDARAVKMVSKSLAEKLQVFAFDISGSGRSEVVTIAMSDPTDLAAVDQLAFHTGKRIKAVLSGASEIVAAIHKHYDAGKPPVTAGKPPPGAPFPNRISPTAPQSAAPGAAAQAQPAPQDSPYGRIVPLAQQPLGGQRSIPTPTSNKPAVAGPTLADFKPPPAARQRPEPARQPPPQLTPAPLAEAQKPGAEAPRQGGYIPPPVPPLAQRNLAPEPLEEIEPQDLGPMALESAHLAREQFSKQPVAETARLADLEPLPPGRHAAVPAPAQEDAMLEGLEPIASSALDEGPIYLGHGSSGLDLDLPGLPGADAEPSTGPAWSENAAPATPAAPEWSAAPPEAAAAPPEWVAAPDHPAAEPEWGAAPAEAAPAAAEWDAAPTDAAPTWDAAPAPAGEPGGDGAPTEAPAAAAEQPTWDAAPAAAAEPTPAEGHRDPAFGEARDWSAEEQGAAEADAHAEASAASPAAAPAEWAAAPAQPEQSWDTAPISWDASAADAQAAAADSETAPDAQGTADASAEAPPSWGEELPADAILGEAGLIESAAEHQHAAAADAEAPPDPAEPDAVQTAFGELGALDDAAPPVEARTPAEHTEAEVPDAWGALEDPLAAHGEQKADAANAPAEEAYTGGVPSGWESLRLAPELTPDDQPAAASAAAHGSEELHPAEGAHAADTHHARAEIAEQPHSFEEQPHSFAEPDGEGLADSAAAHGELAAGASAAEDAHADEREGEDLTFSDDELAEGESPASAADDGIGAAAPEGWTAAPAEETPVGAGWLGEALAATSPLSASDVGTLAAVGVDVNDGAGALRLVAGLLRVLHRRGLIDLEDVAADVRAARPEVLPTPPESAAPAPGEEVAVAPAE